MSKPNSRYPLLSLIVLVLFINQAKADLVIVASADGYANVRSQPVLDGEIITPLQNNTALLIDGVYADEHPDTKWHKVYYGRDPYCMDCTPDLSEGYETGFIHQSQLKKISSLTQADSTVFHMHYTVSTFNPSGKDIRYSEDAATIERINGKSYFGADCGIPQTEITQATAWVVDRQFDIPMDFFWGILHAGNNFQYYKHQDNFFALQRLGDGACFTDIVWVFDSGGLKQRILGASY